MLTKSLYFCHLDKGDLMLRRARKKSRSGIYHVVLRGINKQRIFEDDQDYQKFLETIKKHKEASGYKICAYCLMSNHIHLLMKEGRESLGIAFRRIEANLYIPVQLEIQPRRPSISRSI